MTDSESGFITPVSVICLKFPSDECRELAHHLRKRQAQLLFQILFINIHAPPLDSLGFDLVFFHRLEVDLLACRWKPLELSLVCSCILSLEHHDILASENVQYLDVGVQESVLDLLQ